MRAGTVAKLAPPLVQLGLLLLVARRGSLDDVGRLALASAASFLCGSLAELGFATTLSLPRLTFGTAEPPLRATERLRVGAAFGGAGLYSVLWAAGLGGHDPVLLLVAPLPFALAISSSYSGAMNASGMLRVEGAVSLAESVAILAIASIGSFHGSAFTWALLGLTLGRAGGTIARAQLPFALATLAIVVQGQADMLAIGFFGSLAVAGVYGPLLQTTYAPLLSAEALDELGDSGWLARHRRAAGLCLGVLLAGAFALLAEPFLRFLLHRPLPDLTPAVSLFALVVVARFVALVFNVEVLRAGRQRDEIPILGLASLALALGGALAAAAGSLTGPARARLRSEVIIAVGYVLLARRASAQPAPALADEPPPGPEPLRLLFLAPFPPSLDGGHGGSRVIAQLLDRMAARHRVALMCLRHPDDAPVDPRLRTRLDLVVEVERRDVALSPRLRALHGVRARLFLLAGTPLWATELEVGVFRRRLLEVLREWRPDVVQVEYTAMGIYLREVGVAGTLAVLGEPEPPTSAAIEYRRTSRRDRLLRRLDVRAWRRFEREVLPLVRRRLPHASLHVVGDKPPVALRAGAADGVFVTGRVSDLAPYVERAAVVAAPIRFGGGMRVKVLEALAAGKPVVASSLAVEGLDVTDGDQLLVAETDEEFAERIAHVLEDRELRAHLGERARSWARENLTWDASVAAHERLYARLLAARRLAAPAGPLGAEALGAQPHLGHPFGEGSVRA